MSLLQQAADQLWQAQVTGTPCEPVRKLLGDEANLDNAYRIQQINIDRALAQGERLTGCKIGLTSTSVQKQLGVDQPDFGRLFASMAVADGEPINASRLLQPKIEAEVALVLEKDLNFDINTITDLINATAYVLPALEIVGSRVANWDITLTDTVADNASSGLYVLGNRPVRLADVDLINCGMVIERMGAPVSTGSGAACLGNPLYAALWLANVMAKRGAPLRAGDVILTGALGPMVPVTAGDVFHARIQGLGEVRAQFEHN